MNIKLTKEELLLILDSIQSNPKYYLFTNVIGITDKTALALLNLYYKLRSYLDEDYR